MAPFCFYAGIIIKETIGLTMEPTIPVHYHQLPLITGTDIVYEEALPLWDMNAKRIVVGDGVTPGGVLIPNFNDDL